jgi:hypothetical protein
MQPTHIALFVYVRHPMLWKCCARQKMTVSEACSKESKRIIALLITLLPLPDILKYRERKLNSKHDGCSSADGILGRGGAEPDRPFKF